MSEVHNVYLIPGMFGFANLAGYDYFGHLRGALERRYADAGVPVSVQVVATVRVPIVRVLVLVVFVVMG